MTRNHDTRVSSMSPHNYDWKTSSDRLLICICISHESHSMFIMPADIEPAD